MRIQDDLYLTVNEEWLKQAVIPEGKPACNAFQSLDEEIETKLMRDFDLMLSGTKEIVDTDLNEFIKLYRALLDQSERDVKGVEPLKKHLAIFEQLNSWQDVNTHCEHLISYGYPMPFDLGVSSNIADSNKHAMYLSVPDTILPNKEFYSGPQKDKLLDVYRQMAEELVALYYPQTAKDMVAKTMKFDASFIEYIKTSEENADYTKMYNPRSLDVIANYSNEIDFNRIIKVFFPNLTEIIVTEPRYFENMNQFVSKSSFTDFKAWATVKTILGNSNFLTEAIRLLGSKYSMAVSGIDKALEFKKFNYKLAGNIFNMVIGDYFAKNYFGPKAKQDVEAMITNMISIYKQRLLSNDWLEAETISMAVKKLDNLDVMIGYPEQYEELYSLLKYDENLDIVSNMMEITRVKILYNFAKLDKPVDRHRWGMSPHQVNACYDPSNVLICFPAAILQAPFYSLAQSKSENYGGIGAIIAHEISHAFDNNGAKFDHLGNLNNWWTPNDLAMFEKLTQKVIDQFNGLKLHNPEVKGEVNGKLVVSENIADLGGISCALAALELEDDVDLEAFFANWARGWRQKATTEYQDLLLSIDVHAPNECRANITPRNLDAFHKAFGVKPGDGMWMDPKDRIQIW